MMAHVRHKVTGLDESLSTLLTLVWSFTGVMSHMSDQRTRLHVTLAADCTPVTSLVPVIVSVNSLLPNPLLPLH